jgi:hypothetical protein
VRADEWWDGRVTVEDLNDATYLGEAASAKAGNDAGGPFQQPAKMDRATLH